MAKLIRDIMTRGAEIVSPDSSIQDAAQIMRNIDVGAVPVCNGDRVVGMITDRDIVLRAVADGRFDAAVADVMTEGLEWCFEDDAVTAAAAKMKAKQIRRLPVMSADKRLVGMLSLGDLAVEGSNDARSGEVLEKISEPSRPDR
ncbi:MAG: CBS domain-containing protein [Rhodothermales bacterium]|nr:CBS domain-containing protein [Rhodothermales bacterium]